MVQLIETNRWIKWTDNDQHKSSKKIIWLNNLLHSIYSLFLFAIDNLQLLQSDGTFETVSQMIFTATRFENAAMIRCEADNVVMRNEMDKPLHEFLNLEVMCKKNENAFSLSLAFSLLHPHRLLFVFPLFEIEKCIEKHKEIKLKI